MHSQQEQQQQLCHRFIGVSRDPWSVTWDAHVQSPAAGLRAQLGIFTKPPAESPKRNKVGKVGPQCPLSNALEEFSRNLLLSPMRRPGHEEALVLLVLVLQTHILVA